jgi:isorenieratene synthase
VNFKAMLKRHEILPKLIPAKEEQWIYRAGNFIGRAPIGSTIRNSFIPAPFHYLQLFLLPQFLWMLDVRDWASLLSIWSTLVMAMGVDPFVEDQPLQGLTFGEALKRWGPAMRALFFGLTRNGLSTDPDQVPLAGFLAFLRFYTLMRRDAWGFDYLPNGSGELCENLSVKILQFGGTIRLKSRVMRVEKVEDWIVHIQRDGFTESARAPFIILASDSPAAESIIKSSFPSDAVRAGSPHPSNGAGEPSPYFFPHGLAHAVIRFWFDREPRKHPEAGIFSGDFIMHNFFWLDNIYDPYRKWHDETGGSCIEVHVYGPVEVLKKSDAILLTSVLTDFYRAFPELKGHLIKPHIQRNAATHTLPALGARGTHLGVETSWEKFFCAGDWVRHESPAFFLERACVTGMEAANRILRACGREEFDVQSYPPPEPFAAWIEMLMMRGRKKRRLKKGSAC